MCDFISHTFWHPHDSSAAFPQKYLRDVVIDPPVVGLYRKTCQPLQLLLILGRCQVSARWIVPNVFPNPDVQSIFWILLNSLSTFLSHVLPHSSISALPRSYTSCYMRHKCVVWGHIPIIWTISHNKVTMTRRLREAAMFRWLIKVCWWSLGAVMSPNSDLILSLDP